MSTMLLSIKPEYAKVILEGKKQYEFRKIKPKEYVNHIILYASSPQKQVVGEAVIDEILEGTPKEIWEIAKSAAGITRKFFFSYYAGKDKAVAYKLKDVVTYKVPKELSDYGISQAPQSFIYLDRTKTALWDAMYYVGLRKAHAIKWKILNLEVLLQ